MTIRTYRSRVALGPQQSCTDLGFIRTLAVPLHNQRAVRWREGRRGLAVAATFPTAPSGRAVAAVQDLLVRIARGLR